MPDDSSKIRPEWIVAWRESLAAFRALVLEPMVIEAWKSPSNLDGYSVGGIAGHVLSLVVGLRDRIDARPSDLAIISHVDWYRGALSREHPGLVQIGEQVASAGSATVAAELDAAGRDLDRCFRDASSDRAVPLASVAGSAVRLDDFLRTRFVEILVHADDIALSVGLPCPAFPLVAAQLAESVIEETTPSPRRGLPVTRRTISGEGPGRLRRES